MTYRTRHNVLYKLAVALATPLMVVGFLLMIPYLALTER
jgi:hypothetical protein